MNHETALLWGKAHFFNAQIFPLDHLTLDFVFPIMQSQNPTDTNKYVLRAR